MTTPTEAPGLPPVVLRELEYLDRDIDQIGEFVLQNQPLLDALGATDNPLRHTFHAVTVDLAFQARSHAMAVSVVLPFRLTSVLALQRALWEAVIGLRYLTAHHDRDREATIFRAYSYLKDKEDFPDDRALVEERDAILAKIGPEITGIASKRGKTWPRTWSGKPLTIMAKEGGAVGFEKVYGPVSAQVHGHRIGRFVKFGAVTGDQQQVHFGDELSDEDIAVHAGFARRGLHAAFIAIWGTVDSPKVQFDTPEPTWEGANAS